jgi:uncharacterized sporulation protein YeaH/YhbH (DUF444 family)
MGINVVDRRNNPKGKSSENRQRIIKRVEDQIKKALPDIIKNTNVKDLTSSNKGVKVPVKGISEPQFSYDRNSGDKKHVHPGNKEYVEGDKIKKNDGGEGKGKGKGSNDPTITEDDFTITISRDEFLEYFFNDLELPDMVKKHLNQIVDFKQKRAGYSSYGNPNRLNIVKSFKNSMTRRMASGIFYDKKIKDIEDKLKDDRLTDQDRAYLEKELDKLKKMKLSVSFMEEVDLQYNNFEKYPVPVTSAVMFCIMDVSGSMGEAQKDISKRFFMLLYMFLTKQYEKIEMVFIRHHTEAKEVNEDEFFNSKESGGTVVVTALELLDKIINERYSTNWNIYVAQASDGDVWDDSDATDCYKILNSEILKKIQYMVYIDICKNEYTESDLYKKYKILLDRKENFNIGKIFEVSDIWKVFQEFFKKKVSKND